MELPGVRPRAFPLRPDLGPGSGGQTAAQPRHGLSGAGEARLRQKEPRLDAAGKDPGIGPEGRRSKCLVQKHVHHGLRGGGGPREKVRGQTTVAGGGTAIEAGAGYEVVTVAGQWQSGRPGRVRGRQGIRDEEQKSERRRGAGGGRCRIRLPLAPSRDCSLAAPSPRSCPWPIEVPPR